MPYFLYALIAVIAVITMNSVNTASNFRQQMLALNRNSVAYRNAMNGVQLAMSDLDKINAQYGINSVGMVNALLCKSAASTTACDNFKLWGSDATTSAYLAKIASFVDTTNPPVYKTEDGIEYTVTLLPKGDSSQLGSVIFRVITKIAERTETTDMDILFPQVKGNGLANAIMSDHIRCLFCHVTVFGNVAAYANSEIHHANDSKIHGKLLFAKKSDTDPTNYDNNTYQVMARYPWSGSTDNSWWSRSGLATYDMTLHAVGWGDDQTHLPTAAYPKPAMGEDGDTYNMSSPHAHSAWTSTGGLYEFQRGDQESSTFPGIRDVWAREISTSPGSLEVPYNLMRQNLSLPKVNPYYARSTAHGTITAAKMGYLKKGGTYNSGSFMIAGTTFTDVVPGHVYLKGTSDSPITYSGNIYVDGDVIISGYLSGQGTITAAGNIYIIGDLRYKNAPTEFDGSATSNKTMSTVSQTQANSMSVAMSMRDKDRLMLFAGKNILIGSPFMHNNSINFDAKYAQTALFSVYNPTYGYNPTTGELMDILTTTADDGTSSSCYLLPWDSRQSCKADLPAGFKSVTHNVAYDASKGYEYYNTYLRGHEESESYKALFYPTANWIAKDDFFNLIKDDAAVAQAYVDDATWGKERVSVRVQWPKLNGGFGSATETDLLNAIEDKTGLISEGANYASDQAFGKAAGYTLKNAIQDFIKVCRASYVGDSSMGYVGVGSEKLNNILNFNIDNSNIIMNQSLFRAPDDSPIRINNFTCRFVYSKKNKVSSVQISHNGLSQGVGVLNGTSYRWVAGRSLCNDYSGSSLGVNDNNNLIWSDKPCLKKITDQNRLDYYIPNGSPSNPDGRWDVLKDASLDISFNEVYQQIIVNTNLWANSKFKFIPRTHVVESFLFANQFIFKNQSYNNDSQIRLHGGFVAKELVGQFNSPAGKRSKNANYSGVMEGAYNYETASGLWIVHDPRFMFIEDVPTGLKYIVNN